MRVAVGGGGATLLVNHALYLSCLLALAAYGLSPSSLAQSSLPVEPLAQCSRLTSLVISEIMYHPAKRGDGRELEFIELFNSGATPEDISGYRLSGDVAYTFLPGQRSRPRVSWWSPATRWISSL